MDALLQAGKRFGHLGRWDREGCGCGCFGGIGCFGGLGCSGGLGGCGRSRGRERSGRCGSGGCCVKAGDGGCLWGDGSGEWSLALFFEFAQGGDFLSSDGDLLDVFLALLKKPRNPLFSFIRQRLNDGKEVFLALLEKLFFLFEELSIECAESVGVQVLVVSRLFDQSGSKGGLWVIRRSQGQGLSLLKQQIFVLLLQMEGSAQKADGSVDGKCALFPRLDGFA